MRDGHPLPNPNGCVFDPAGGRLDSYFLRRTFAAP
jgi:hypothetical protein